MIKTACSGSESSLPEIDVDRFLIKPWLPDELIELPSGRTTKCVSCGLPLPLRRAFAGQVERSWICANCGGRYRGVIDKDSHPDGLLSVRPADSG